MSSVEKGLIQTTMDQADAIQIESSDKLRNEAERLRNEGKMYIAAEHLSKAAELKSRLKLEKYQMEAAILYENAATYYRSANYCIEAAKNVEKAAEIHIKLEQYIFAINCYAQAKNYYGDAGDYSKCGKAYAKEMMHKEMLYKEKMENSKIFQGKVTNFFHFAKFVLFKKTMGYGESLKALIITGTSLIFLFTFIYFLFQLVILPDNNTENLFYINPKYNIEYFFVCFKFSLSLFSGFSTTPYQLYDFNIISTIEVLFGNLFLALFIAVIIRKISRR